MIPTAEINAQIDRFKLNVNGFQVFPGYWINTVDFHPGGFKGGKGSPEDLQSEVNRKIALARDRNEEINVRRPADARNFLYRNLIGIDCSNLVYHVAEGIATQLEPSRSLQDSIHIPRSKLVAASQKPNWREVYELTPQEATELPEMVPLRWVVDTYKKEPQSQVNVEALQTTVASLVIDHLEDVEPGDLIIMRRNSSYKHLGIVSNVNGNEWTMWDSYRPDGEFDGYGGVTPHDITIADFNKPLQAQSWQNFDTGRYTDFYIRRLRALTS